MPPCSSSPNGSTVSASTGCGSRRTEIDAALAQTDPAVRDALETAAASIAAFHRSTLTAPHSHEADGVTVRSWRQPVGRAGCYVPGGRARYPSTVLMTAIPAKVAGVAEVALCVPPDRTGQGPHGHPGRSRHRRRRRGLRRRRRPGHRCPRLRHASIRRRRRDRGAGQRLRGRGQARGRRTWTGGHPLCVRRAVRGRRRRRRNVPADFAAIDLIVQAEHGPDGLAWLLCWSDGRGGRGGRRHRTPGGDGTPPGGDPGHPRPQRVRRAVRRRRAGHGGGQRDRPRAPRAALCERAPSELGARCATPARCSSGRTAPASIGDYLAGPSHTLPTFGSARFASVLSVDDFTKHMHTVAVDRRRFRTGRSPRGRPRHGRGVRRPRPLHHAAPGRPMTPAASASPPATTSPSWRATTRRRSTWRSGSTPTSRPSRRPTALRRPCWPLLSPASTGTATPTGPPPACAPASAPCTASIPTPGLRGQRLQRGAADPAADLRRIRTHGGHVRADLRAAQPHRPAHRCHGGGGRARRRLRAGRSPRSSGCSTSATRPWSSSARPTTPPAGEPPRARSTPSLGLVGEPWRRCSSWTRRTVSSPPGRPSSCSTEDRPLVVTRTYSKTWSMAAARLGLPASAPAGSSPSSTRWSCPTTSTCVKQAAGLASRSTSPTDMEAPGGRRGRGAGPHRRRPRPTCDVDVWPSGANFVLFRPGSVAGPTCGRRCSTRRAGAQLRVVAPSGGLPACHHRHPGGGRRVPRRPEGGPDVNEAHQSELSGPPASTEASWSSCAGAVGPPRRRRIDVAVDLDGSGRSDVATGHPLLRPHARPARPPRRLRPDRARPWATWHIDTHHTIEDTGILLGAAPSPRRWATRPACVASPRCGSRSTRPWSTWSLDLSGRPYLHWELDYPLDPVICGHAALRRAARRGVLPRRSSPPRASPCT